MKYMFFFKTCWPQLWHAFVKYFILQLPFSKITALSFLL